MVGDYFGDSNGLDGAFVVKGGAETTHCLRA